LTKTITSILVLSLGLFPLQLMAGKLDSYFAGVKTIEAGFTQTMVTGTTREQVSKGRLYVVSPDKFRLDYLEPYSQIYIADGKQLISYDQDLEQVIIKPQGEVLTNTPAMVLSNPKRLETDYTVESQGKWDGQNWYLLTPKRQDTNFEQIRLAFKDKQLLHMELKDSFGQFSRLTFTNMKYNSSIPAKTFTFTPPDGVDIIQE